MDPKEVIHKINAADNGITIGDGFMELIGKINITDTKKLINADKIEIATGNGTFTLTALIEMLLDTRDKVDSLYLRAQEK